jgi:hypothetical protein
MSCKFKKSIQRRQKEWKLPCNIFNKIIPYLFKEREFAGNIILGQSVNKESILKLGQIKSGHTASVKVENGICNYHTHPHFCYTGMGNPEDSTIWGWPSGEDMRESISFALRGNFIHLVITLEGIYSIEVNPLMIQQLINVDEKDAEVVRGAIIGLIEHYFKSTHGFRCVDYNENQKRICTPYDWVHFANHFNLNNLYKGNPKSNAKKCTKELPCSGFPDYDDNYKKKNHDVSKIRGVTGYVIKENRIRSSNKFSRKHFTRSLVNKFHAKPQAIHDSYAWQEGQWFRIKFKESHINGKSLRTILEKNPSVKNLCEMWKEVSKNPQILTFPGTLSFCTYDIENTTECHFNETIP